MNLSVVIVNWNAGGYLEECVRSALADLASSGTEETEVLVVDNASSDGSMDAVARRFTSARCIRNPENLGFARATNQGIRLSTGKHVLLLNPDTEVRPGAVATLMEFLRGNPAAGAAGPMLLNTDGSLQESAYPEPTLFREAWRLFHLDTIRPMGSYRMAAWRADTPREVDVLTGACILARREVLEHCGLLDERYFIYSEDQDLCRRIRSGGSRLFWVPRAQVVHHGGRSTRHVKSEMFVRLYAEKTAYLRKHSGNASAAAYKALLFVVALSRQPLVLAALLQGGSGQAERLELARNYRRLARELPGL